MIQSQGRKDPGSQQARRDLASKYSDRARTFAEQEQMADWSGMSTVRGQLKNLKERNMTYANTARRMAGDLDSWRRPGPY